MLVQDGIHQQNTILAHERPVACRRFVEHHTQGEQITASINLFSADLLRRHVGRGSGDGAFLGERILFGFVFWYITRDNLGQSKIENLHPSGAYDENVSDRKSTR